MRGGIETDCHDNWETLNWNNQDIRKVYASEDSNLKIRTGKKDGVAYIYCSSNALYKKDDREDFISKIIENDRFEWENITLDVNHEKVIYIRDVWLSWYSNGLNSRYNTLENIIERMKEETAGLKVVTIGISSGGFMAAILASSLNAKFCLDFAGQFSLQHHWTHVETNPFLKAMYSKNTNCFGEAYLHLGGETPIYYFEPVFCEQDVEQAKYAIACHNVKVIRIRSKVHGCAISSVALKKLMNYDAWQMEKLYQSCENRIKSPLWFSVKIAGIYETLSYSRRKAIKLIHKFIMRKD